MSAFPSSPPLADIPRRTELGPAPLTFGQEQLWLIDRASPRTTAWNIVRPFRLRGPLNVDALQASIEALCARHEILRTVYVDTTDGPRAIVLPAAPNPIRRITLRALALETRAAAAQRIADDEEARPFALGEDLPFRVVLASFTDDDNVLCLATPHIAFDAWSANVMLRELSDVYTAFLDQRRANLPPLAVQFLDYATWERGPEHQAELAEKISFWRRQLADGPSPLSLPTYRHGPLVPLYDAALSRIVLPPELVESVTLYARTHGVTVYFALLATYCALLGRYSGQDDILVGSPIAGRTHPETQDLIGFFVNTLVLRTQLDDDPTFAQLLARVRETFFDSYERGDVPVEQILREMRKAQELTAAPFFNAIFSMEDVGSASLAFPGVAATPIECEQRATTFDFTLIGKLRPEGLRLTLRYRSDRFTQLTADRFLVHFRRLLEAAIATPSVPVSTLPLVSADERRALVGVTPQSYREPAPLSEQFAEMVRLQPGALAIVCGQDRRTYAELDAAAERVKRQLAALGVGRGALVGLALDRSADAIAALLGIWQSGAAYVPLPPDLPAFRIAAIANECGLRFVISDAAQAARIAAAGLDNVIVEDDLAAPQASAVSAAVTAPDLDDLAYVIFTSGSTGIPKGVAVTQRNLASYVAAIMQRLDIRPQDRWQFAAVSSLGADLGNTTIFPALATGGTLHIIPGEIATDAESYARWAAAEPVDVLKITPSHLAALLAVGDRHLLPRRWLVLGGEVCPVALTRRVQALSACAILNHYGPTETTVGACTHLVGEQRATGEVDDRTSVPIGSPLAGVRCYVLDRHGEPVPAGMCGELFIGGAGVAQGYMNRPELTRARFLPDPFAIELGARMYSTGDRVRQLPDGELEFLGRADDQVKIRGHRVELGEVASMLGAHPDVAQSAAALRSSAAGEPQLVAYATLQPGQGQDTSAEVLRQWLAQRLPDYMVPSAVGILNRLPLKSNGKLDRDALRNLDKTLFPAAPDFTAPRTPTEQHIAALWQEILGIERVGVTADFLTLGFHSILAIRALAKLGRSFAVRLPMRTFFESKTIERLAVAIDAEVLRATEVEIERSIALAESLSDDEMLALAGASAAGKNT